MASERGGEWRWANVPVPEPHVAGLLAGAVLHVVRPWPLTSDGPLRAVLGGASLALGLGIVAWAVMTVGRQDIGAPASLVTEGPFRYSRNPMYFGWTGLYVGIAVAANAAWPLILLPLVAVAVHWTVRREERVLERRLGADYRAYCREVRRYL